MVQGHALVPEFGAGLQWPLYRLWFGSDTVPCVTFLRSKGVTNALPSRPPRSFHLLVEAGASALPHGDESRWCVLTLWELNQATYTFLGLMG